MSDTPISDSTAHNIADLGMLCRRLERELNVANAENKRLTAKVAQLYAGAEAASQRIKRLEDAGNELYEGWRGNRNNMDRYLEAWRKARGAKL